jgi:hypothetical protein
VCHKVSLSRYKAHVLHDDSPKPAAVRHLKIVLLGHYVILEVRYQEKGKNVQNVITQLFLNLQLLVD